MTAVECLLMTGALLFFCGVAGVVMTFATALCDWLDERQSTSGRRN